MSHAAASLSISFMKRLEFLIACVLGQRHDQRDLIPGRAWSSSQRARHTVTEIAYRSMDSRKSRLLGEKEFGSHPFQASHMTDLMVQRSRRSDFCCLTMTLFFSGTGGSAAPTDNFVGACGYLFKLNNGPRTVDTCPSTARRQQDDGLAESSKA